MSTPNTTLVGILLGERRSLTKTFQQVQVSFAFVFQTSFTVLEMTEMLYRQNASFNYYMFHGGTNFGFWNGAEYAGGLITSYDYWAPLQEPGTVSEKYTTIRNYISTIRNWPNTPQAVPAAPYVSVLSITIYRF